MIPSGDFIVPAIEGNFIHPWTPGITTSLQWGPVEIQDASLGLLHTLWISRVFEKSIFISSDTHVESVVFTHSVDLIDASIAFDQNANLVIAFSDISGASFLYWWNPTIPGYDILSLPSGTVTPRVTLDDARPFNVAQSDVILVYSFSGGLKYRLQRDRYTIEYTPIDANTSTSIPADVVYHVSMMSTMRLGIVYRAGDVTLYETPQIMKKQIVIQKSPVEDLPITFDFNHVLSFGDTIETAAVNIVVFSGTDPNPVDMLVGSPINTDHSVTQNFTGGLTGNIYKISMSARTAGDSVYVTEGVLYVNDSPAIDPPPLP